MVGDEVDARDRNKPVVRLDIPARLDLVTVVRMVAAASASAADSLEGDRLDDLRWAVSEAVTNAVEANHLTETPGRVHVEFALQPSRVCVAVTDEGPGMPLMAEAPEIDDPDRLEIEGGFGIPLMQMLASSPVRFDTGPQGTTVRLELAPRS